MTVYNLVTDFGATVDGTGTNDAQALVAAGNALNGTSGHQLIIPAGELKPLSNYSSGGRSAARWAVGITQLTVTGAGTGSTTWNANGVWNWAAGDGIRQDGSHFGAIQTVQAGSITTTLVTASDHSLFSVDQWVLIGGLNIQDIWSTTNGYGFPPNLHYFEYVQIQAIDTVAGVLTFYTPLVNTYLSTWPTLNPGSAFEVNSGGAAGIYSLQSTWDTQMEYQSMTITNTSSSQIYGVGRSMVWRDCAFTTSGFAPVATQNQTFALYNCTHANTMEVDKLVTNFIADGTTWGTLDFQSSSITNVTLNDFTGNVVGTGLNTRITNSTIGTLDAGAFNYGVSGDLDISDTSVTTWQTAGMVEKGPSDLGVQNYLYKSNGVISLPFGTTVSNVTDNGSGKARYTVASSSGFESGKYQNTGLAYQTLTTNGSTSSGTKVLNFASVPSWVSVGDLVRDNSNNQVIPQFTTVASFTSTTVTLSTNVLSTINSSTNIRFTPQSLAGYFTILAVPNGTTIDMDTPFPTGFSYSGGAEFANSALRWAVPGKVVYWGGWSTGGPTHSKAFRVDAVRYDADRMYVETNEPGGFPTVPLAGDTALWINTPPAQRVRASGLSGSSAYNTQLNYPASYNRPLGTYFKSQVTATQINTGTFCWGNLVSITIDVLTAYTGTAPNLFLHFATFDNLRFLVDGVDTTVGWGVNAKVTGRRVILPTNTVSNATAQSGDGPLLVPAWTSSLWINTGFACFYKTTAAVPNMGATVDISGESPSVWPDITVEILTDQGLSLPVAVTPLRMRLRG